MSLPDYNFLSAPLWLITLLHWVTLTLHFLAMNFVVGGLVCVLWGKLTNRWEHPTVAWFVKMFPNALAATITLGVAPLLFLQLVYHRQVYTAAILSGWFWLLIIPAVIIGYYCLYTAAFAGKRLTPLKEPLLAIALLAFLYVSFVYSTVFSQAENPEGMRLLYLANQSGTAINPEPGDWLLRWLHMILGAMTVGGFLMGAIGRDHEDAHAIGKRIFLWSWIVTALVGFAYLFSLGEYIRPFMRSFGIWALTVGIVLSALSVHQFFKRKFMYSGILIIVSLFTMVISRHYVRIVKLQGEFEPASLPVKPQWDVFLIFLFCFALAGVTIWYMLRLFLRPAPNN